jgi:hypothetical protein
MASSVGLGTRVCAVAAPAPSMAKAASADVEILLNM